MYRPWWLACALVAATALPAPADEKGEKARAEAAVKAEVERLVGTWTATSGKSLTFKAEAFPGNTVNLGGFLPEGTANAAWAGWGVNPDKTPREISFGRQDGLRHSYYPGIYELKGDTLTICVDFTPSPDGPPMRKRPTKFEVTKGSSYTLITFKRTRP